MPLPMIHLSIAKSILDSGYKANDVSQFYLGSISPDAIHMRKDTNRKDKNDTHLIPEGKRWIDVDEAEYYGFMLDYFLKNQHKADKDFLCGYGIHILADMIWTKQVYYEFVERYKKDPSPVQEERMAYYNDTDGLDLILYNESAWRSDVWQYLRMAHCADFLDLLSGDEINLWKERTLNWFDSGNGINKYPVKYIAITDVHNFLSTCIGSILDGLNF